MNIILFYSIIIGVIGGLIYSFPDNTAFTINFTNYTNAKYNIELQYPSDWEITEKTSRFDEGADISIDSDSIIANGYISIIHIDNLIEEFGSKDLRTSLFTFFKQAITNDYSREYRVIEQPSFTTIGSEDTGTFLYTDKEKYEDYAIKWARQYWLLFINDQGYLITYSSSADTFDKPENKEIRDKFINSIKFINHTN